ncbi:leucine-rich repeat and transmembrane domain-containing protein 1 isoform X2 [Scyliorhinus canicula]|uniref:leucine-rich repeat and transmembrane domain-containing protein 1 isoform X2 n=1 Tax=Scyliorhinus canicula TaxID=7830 RepID=UPI0018F6C5E4|nr:leucine-rich repeat and transmembrane domain-containing protein 1 isoform X2 [Scyliorhinus canicula]
MRGKITLEIFGLLFVHSVIGCPERCLCNITLKEVSCTGNGLSEIPNDVPPDTEILYLQNNHIHTISNAAFTDMPQLQVLDLSNNIISSLSSNTFDGLHNLLNLNLANNSITYMDNKILHSTENLKQLDLSFNNLTSLPEGLFENQKKLIWLGMHQNQLHQLDTALLDSLSNLQVLLFQKNHWKCDCHVAGLKLWLESFLYKGGQIDEILCMEPEDLRSKDLMKIPHEKFQPCPSVKHKPSNAHSEHGSSTTQNHHGKNEHDHHSECKTKSKQRAGSLRHAIATIVITGVVCGIVCLMMLAAAIYGCSYAALMAKYHRELKKLEHLGPEVEQGSAEEKEPLDGSQA